MIIDKDIWNDLLAKDINDRKVQQEILYELKRFNIVGVTKQIAMRAKIWDDPIYDHFAIELCRMIEKQHGAGKSFLLLLTPQHLQENRLLLWNLLA